MGETRVSKVTIARLHNCGNYEHVRYEISVDVGANDNPASVVEELESLLNDLKPLRNEYDYDLRRAREVLAKPASELTDLDFRNMSAYRERVLKADEEVAKRQRAYERLNAFGGSRVYADAKDKWDERDDYPI